MVRPSEASALIYLSSTELKGKTLEDFIGNCVKLMLMAYENPILCSVSTVMLVAGMLPALT